MRAKWLNAEGLGGTIEMGAIVPQLHENGMFMLVGFEDWEAVNNEKMSCAVTNIIYFDLKENSIGFTQIPD